MTTEQLAKLYFDKAQEVKSQKEKIYETRLKIQQAKENESFTETAKVQELLNMDLSDQTALHDQLLKNEGDMGMDLIQRLTEENIAIDSEQKYWLSDSRFFTVIVKSKNNLVINGPFSTT